MSTTPTTPEPRDDRRGSRTGGPTYTVVGGPRADHVLAAPHRLVVLILNRGPRHKRKGALDEAVKLGAGEVISVERATADVDTLSKEHPQIRFLLVPVVQSAGELINLGVSEARGRHVLVVWSDMRVDHAALERALDVADGLEAVCLAPSLAGRDGGAVPVRSTPTLRGARFAVLHAPPDRTLSPTLYPFDYCGLYRKDRFAALGGFEPSIPTPYWQKLDFGLRAYLYGGSIQVCPELKIGYRSELPPDDTTPDPAYRRFYLRNVAVRYRGDGAYVPLVRFPSFFLRSGMGPAAAAAEFRDARRWVRARRRAYRKDLKELVESWGPDA